MASPPLRVTVVGGGLAGTEASWQLAQRGVWVRLYEMRPQTMTPAHSSGGLAELVCSNSLRSDQRENAAGLLKEELRLAGSFVLECADQTRVPAGGALAVDREAFSALVTQRILSHPLIEVVRQEVLHVPESPAILAAGPLISSPLAADLARLAGEEHLFFHDAIAPIVAGDSLDRSRVFAASRWGKGGDDYLNCSLDQAQYNDLVKAIREADLVAPRPFEEQRHFEGCLPVEVMAARGQLALAYGPLKPVGLMDPVTKRRPFAVIQLRPEDSQGEAYNIVGFQTRMRQGDQRRIIRSLPGLERAEILRYGSIHRNTFVHAPRVLNPDLTLKARPTVALAGQITGVEGYVESVACGLVAGLLACSRLAGELRSPPPTTTALGALLGHLRRPSANFQPSNVQWGLFDPLPEASRAPRKVRRGLLAQRALADLKAWLEG